MTKREIYIICVLLAYFLPSFFTVVSMATLFALLSTLVKLFVTFYYIPKVLLQHKVTLIDILVVLFLFFQAFAAFQSQTLYLNYVGGQFFLLGLYSFLKHFLLLDCKTTIKSLFLTFILFLCVQVITQLLFPVGFDSLHPTGDNRLYFLGRKNIATPYIIVGLGSFYLLNKKMNEFISLKEIIFLGLFGILSFLTQSSTAIICYIFFIFIRLMGLKENIGKLYSLVSMAAYVCFSLSIIFSQSTILSTFTAIFSKNATFSGRINIWQLAIRIFEENFWFGRGLNVNFNAWTNGIIVNSAHNTLLDILARTGIFPGVLFIVLLINLFLGKYRIESKTLLAMLASFMIYITMETSSMSILLLIIVLCVYWPRGEEKLHEQVT
ncbi:O-Antigen ligase [Streptococcus oralis]|uniref:O-Antigen ligase n=1 Tax=Streptococcus oralis TaxID=1303 RepID=A0A3R9LIH3_STROR|nr:O-antigen ligase family protein [Streptococcus oralis]RSK10530.1 O-Antigen ligase [Streptococcus oralis]